MADESSTWQVRFLPESRVITEATEFAFLNGVPFVKASKHEEVVARHVTERDRLVEEVRAHDELLDRVEAERDRYRKALEKIADVDRRSRRLPRSAHQYFARKVLNDDA